MPTQHNPVEVLEVGSGKRQRDELKWKPVTVSAVETAGSRAPKAVPVAKNMSSALCYLHVRWH